MEFLKFGLFLLLFLLFVSLAHASSCGTIISNTVLDSNVNSSGTCFNIQAHNIVLDCSGYTINYSQSTTGYGVNNTGGYNNLVIKNCNIVQGSTSTSSHGIRLESSNNNTIKNNSIDIYGNFSFGIWLSFISNNNIIDNNIINVSGYNSSSVDISESNTNTISNSRLYSNYGSSSAYGFSVHNSSYTNKLINSSVSAPGGYDLYFYSGASVYVINSTFNTLYNSSSDWNLYIQWYLDVNITNGTSALQNAEVKGYNNTNNLVFTNLTQSNGFIDRQILTEYMQNKNGKYYQTNYSINATKIGYSSNSTQVNLTESMQINLILIMGDYTLIIWDSTDIAGGNQTRYAGEQVDFYANYTNTTSGTAITGSGVYCGIMFYDSANSTNMTYNSTSSLYQYNRTFSTNGIFDWNVTCNGTTLGYDALTANDTVIISSIDGEGEVPEFSLIGIILSVLIIFIVGNRIVRKRK